MLELTNRRHAVSFGWLWSLPFVRPSYFGASPYITWHLEKRPDRLRRVILEGLAAGIVVALPFIFRGSGEPAVTMQSLDYVGWVAVLGLIGVINSVTLYLINALVDRRAAATE